jgi:general secretion pathway protein L
MAQQTIGIDISDDLLSAVIVAGRGKDARVLSCASTVLAEHTTVADELPQLMEQLQWQDGHCVSGLSLFWFSLRNLFLPFSDEKKVQQILPFELEEQLLSPVDEQIIATSVTGKDETGCQLLVAAVEKETIGQYLDIFQAQGLDPDQVFPASFVLAEYLCRTGFEGDDFLLLYCDMGSMTIVICHQGAIPFMRRLSYPEKVFTDTIFSFDGSRIIVSDRQAADEAIAGLCRVVRKSIDYFCLQHDLEIVPNHVVLAGPMSLGEGFKEKIEIELAMGAKICDLVQAGSATLSAEVTGQWQPAVYDRSLSLALQGGARGGKFNFRRDQFAAPRYLLRSKKQAIGLALAVAFLLLTVYGYLFIDYQFLKKRHDGLNQRMEQVFIKTFPGASPGKDPLMYMRSRMKGTDTVAVSMPLFTGEKRVLAILADISSLIPASIEIHVVRLVIDQDSVRIKGTTDAFNNVNTIKSLLTKSVRFSEVTIVSAAKAKEKGTIRFELRLQLEPGESS